jgi:hypothetical protein
MNEIIDIAERNPFGASSAPAVQMTGLVSVEQQRSVAEVQARMIIARANPRNPIASMDAILRDCTRVTLAKGALYQYARGGASVSGPSIRLAEAMAQRWGNIASGIKEISRSDGYSECVAYAWDLETGYYDERQFQVRHWRDTKGGGYRLTDERDIYELVANMGQRRKRAVLLTVIPGDVQEAAVKQCEDTLNTNADTSPEALQRMVGAFGHFGVTKEMIEKRCQCRVEAIRPAQVVQLSNIYQSVQDEMSSAADWFDMGEQKANGGTTGAWEEISKRHQQTQEERQTTRPPPPSKDDLRKQAAQKKAEQEAADKLAAQLRQSQEREAAERRRQEAEADRAKPAHTATEDAEKRRRHEWNATPKSDRPIPEYYLVDENGELIGDAHDTADGWANAFLDLYSASDNRTALAENNRDTLEEIERDAPTVDDRIRFAIAEIDTIPANDPPADETPTFVRLELKPGRGGKPDNAQYVREYKLAVGMIGAHHYLDWIAAQIPISELPLGSRALVVKAAVERANELGIDPPETFRTLPTHPITTEPEHTESKPAEPDKAEQQCIAWCAEMDGMTSQADLVAMVQNKAISTKVAEWKANRPELYDRILAANKQNKERLSGAGT